MYTTLGISAEQVYGDMYAAWLRDTHEKNTPDVKRLYNNMIDNGFGAHQILLRRQRLGANFINSLSPLLHQSSLVKLDLHGNMLRDVGCELLAQVVRDTPHLTYLDIGANALGCSSAQPSAATAANTHAASAAAANTAGAGAAGTVGGKQGGAAASRGGNGRFATANTSSAARADSRYLSAMQGLGSAIAQHRKLAVLILGSAKGESYANQIEDVGAVYILEGCVLSRTIKRLDLSGNPLAVNGDASAEVMAHAAGLRNAANGGGGGHEDAGGLGASVRSTATSNTTTAAGGGRGGRGESAGTGNRSPASGSAGRTRSAGAGPADASGAHPASAAGLHGGRAGPRAAIELLGQLLRTSSTLSHIRLRAIGLSDAGAAYLFDAVKASRSLLRLDMSENGVSSTVAEAAGRLLLQRTAMARGAGGGVRGCCLQSLVLSDNDLWDNGAAAALARRGSFGVASGGGGLSSTASAHHAIMNAVGGGEGGSGGPLAASVPPSSSSAYVTRTRALRDGGASAGAYYAAAAVTTTSSSTARPDTQPGMLLLSALSNDPMLTTLVLDRCGMDDTALMTLCRSLFTNTTLTVLSMRDNQLSPDGAVQLGRALCRHPCLQKLFLSGNAIGDEGTCALAAALGYPDVCLSELDITHTWLGDRGLIALGVALQTNTSVRVLHVAYNHFTQNGGASFAALLENNQHVVRCELSGTSVPHHIVLRLERATERNRVRADNAESDALKKEVVRLHYQTYKLSEAQIELEGLREKNADVKRTTENFDLQTKQDHNDNLKKIRELEELTENAKQQEVRYVEQAAKLEADWVRAQETHLDDMGFAADRLAAEVRMREEAEEEVRALQAELEEWRVNGPAREAAKRAQLAEMKADQEAWAKQRKEYRERTTEVQQSIAALEAAAPAAVAAAPSAPPSADKKGKKK